MVIRADSFSSTAEVTAYTRHLLDGQSVFNSTTRPTVTEIEKFIDRASGVLNVAISGSGFTPSSIYGNSTAKLACDDWVTQNAVKYTELTQRGTGYSGEEGSRTKAFSMGEDANDFIDMNSLGFIQLGITKADKASAGLAFTGQKAQSGRVDPDDTSLEQPFANRNQWDNND